LQRALRIEEDDGTVRARLVGAAISKDPVPRAHLRADDLLGVESLSPFGECWEEALVQVGTHSVTERAQQGKAIGEDVAARSHLVPNGE
jgi:hypothetical protein